MLGVAAVVAAAFLAAAAAFAVSLFAAEDLVLLTAESLPLAVVSNDEACISAGMCGIARNGEEEEPKDDDMDAEVEYPDFSIDDPDEAALLDAPVSGV